MATAVPPGGKKPAGKVKSAIADLYWLSLVDAPTELLVATNRGFHQIIKAELDGALPEGLEIIRIDLSVDLADNGIDTTRISRIG